MLAFGIILLVIAFAGLIIGIWISDDDNAFGAGILIGLMLVAGIGITVTSLDHAPIKKSTRDNTVTTRIEQSIVDGKVVSCDTVYIFTAKKK